MWYHLLLTVWNVTSGGPALNWDTAEHFTVEVKTPSQLEAEFDGKTLQWHQKAEKVSMVTVAPLSFISLLLKLGKNGLVKCVMMLDCVLFIEKDVLLEIILSHVPFFCWFVFSPIFLYFLFSKLHIILTWKLLRMNSVYGDGPVWTRALMTWGRFKQAESLCVVVVIILNVAHHLALMQNLALCINKMAAVSVKMMQIVFLCWVFASWQRNVNCSDCFVHRGTCATPFFCYSPFSIIVLYDSKNVVCALYNYWTATKENCQLFCLCWMVSVMFPAESSLIDQFLLLSS